MGEHDKRKNLVGGSLAVEVSHDNDAKSAPEETDHQGHRNKRQEVAQGNWNANDKGKGYNAYPLGNAYQRLPQNLSEDNAIAGDRRNKNLLAKIVFPIFDERDQAYG